MSLWTTIIGDPTAPDDGTVLDLLSQIVSAGGIGPNASLEYRKLDLGDTGQVVKASAGHLRGYSLYNAAGSVRFVKFYNKATAASHTDTPVLTIAIEAGKRLNLSGINLTFGVGISVRRCNLIADSDATAPTSGDVNVNLFYA